MQGQRQASTHEAGALASPKVGAMSRFFYARKRFNHTLREIHVSGIPLIDFF
jgi:hypothetical protein